MDFSRGRILRLTFLTVVAADAFLGAGACMSGDRTSPDGTMVRDSAGISIMESLKPSWHPADAWLLDSVPDLVIGTSPHSGVWPISSARIKGAEVPFERVQAVRLLSRGRIVVADDGPGLVMVFDSLGAMMTRFGGRGEGPGEFSTIRDVHSCGGDSIVVVSGRHVHVFDVEGHYGRQAQFWSPGEGRSVSGISADCLRVLITQPGAQPPLGEAGSAETVLWWMDPLGQAADPVVTAGLSDTWTRELYGQASGYALPWGTLPWTHALHRDALVVGHGRTPELRVYESNGGLRSVIRWSDDPAPLTREDRQRYARFRREWLAGMPDDPETPYWFPTLDEFPWLPSEKPLFDRVLIDERGGIWIRRVPPESLGPFDRRFSYPLTATNEAWTVFDPTGVWLGEFEVPERFDLRAVAGGRAFGVATDSLDVQTVQAFRIIQPGIPLP